MLPLGNTSYMRPLPGAARMYPETDVIPVKIKSEEWGRIIIPELLDVKAQRFVTAYGLDPAIARQVVFSEYLPLFEAGIEEGIKPAILSRTITSTLKELRREGVLISNLTNSDIISVLRAVDIGKVGKEAVPDLLLAVAEGTVVDAAIEKSSSGLTKDDIRVIVRKVISEREEFIREKGMGSLGPVMGIVMKEVRGAVDGKIISEVLKEEITSFLSGAESP